MKYEPVIGLEVHIQLQTKSKLFCGDSAAYGGIPNSHVSPVTLAHPGSMPVLNKTAIDFAIRLGLALNSEINKLGWFDRKHYFYPDLPKGYQTSQQTAPILIGGQIELPNLQMTIPIHHIHLEEDAGKSIHDVADKYSCIDLNRAGVPLLELVTEPAIYSAEAAAAFLTELRKLVKWINICDGNMEEGSLRCDANISIRPVGDATLGTRVEVKNINSIRNVRRAIESEIKRQSNLLDKGEKVVQHTRGYDAEKDITIAQRDKEAANDYRYLPCPDLPPIVITDEMVAAQQTKMPVMPKEMQATFVEMGLNHQDANLLTESLDIAEYYLALYQHNKQAKACANWMMGPVKNWLNENNAEIGEFPLLPEQLAGIVALSESNIVSFSTAATRIFPVLINNPTSNPLQIATELNLVMSKDSSETEAWVNQVIAAMPDKVSAYKKGKKGLLALFIGEVKKISKGKADPIQVTSLLNEKLNA